MRRKSERTATKKSKATSPEKKVEKVKRTRTSRRKKHSTSSDESADEISQNPLSEPEPVSTQVEAQEPTASKEDSPEDNQDQVWQVKTAKPSGETGEIQKLKICLTRPPSTPERVDRSPRSKRKHSRAASSSDTPSVDGVEEKKKNKHKSKKAARDLKDELEKSNDSVENQEESVSTMSQSSESIPDQSIVSTTEELQNVEPSHTEGNDKVDESPADTTTSPKNDVQEAQKEQDDAPEVTISVFPETTKDNAEVQDVDDKDECSSPQKVEVFIPILEQSDSTSQDNAEEEQQVSNVEDSKVPNVGVASPSEVAKVNNDHDVLELDCTETEDGRKMSTDFHKEDDTSNTPTHKLERSESTNSRQEDTVPNGQTPPIVISRKRRWGSRPSKVATQKSITISTDVLKDIIPDVKPTEFEEVIEEKKQPKRVEVKDRLERPVLPKIVIDNSENYDKNREGEEKENKVSENLPLSNRKISIVKENENMAVERPPSPPRHKQSSILYITNLVRPFTLPQLKNLLQRTGRIAEDGFWIDKIKSKCFVKYETEDQAVETRHALHGVTWPISNPKTLQVDFSTDEAFEKTKTNEDEETTQTSTIPGTVEDWLREQDMKRERGDVDKPWDKKNTVREWDVGKGDKAKDGVRRDDRSMDKKRNHSQERNIEPAKKFKKKEEEQPAKLLDDLFRKTKTTPCIYWLPLAPETIAIKEEQRRQHMAEHERRLNELRRHRRH